MNTSKLIKLPIKTLNTAVKLKITEIDSRFEFSNRGCLFNGIYYDFRVSRVVSGGILIPIECASKLDIYINQICNDDIFLAVIFKNQVRVYFLERDFFKREEVQKRITYQHKKKYQQLHISIELLESFVLEKFNVQD
jgi:hypothetical protein